MGAHGGYRRVTRFQCSTCHHLFLRKPGAVDCCNEKAHEALIAQRQATVRRNLDRVPKPRVKFSKRDWDGAKIATATGKCPIRACHMPYTIVLEVGGMHSGSERTREQAAKQGSALVKAQIARHLKGHARFD